MSEYIKNYGVEIILNDLNLDSIATEDTSIGLYNRSETNDTSVATDDNVIYLNNVSTFNKNELIILDFNGTEYRNVITEINETDDSITLLTSSPESSPVGDLTVKANSVLRWIQSPITGLTGWRDNILIENGIGEFNRKINLSTGGSVEEPGKCGIKIINTNKIFNTLLNNGVYLLGKIANIYKFENTTKIKQWSGYCENPSYTSTVYSIPLTGRYNKRKSFLGKYITQKEYEYATGSIISNMIPVTFGKFLPSYDSSGNVNYNNFSRFVRIANRVTKMNLVLEEFVEVAENLFIKTALIGGGNQFPVVSNQSGAVYTYTLKPSFSFESIIDGTTYISGTEDVSDKFSNTYLKIVEGDGKDEVRKIDTFILDMDSGKFEITVSDVFENTLSGNATATATDQSWCSIVTAYKEYACDFWAMKKFINMNDGSDIETQPSLAVYNSDEEKYNQIPKYGYEVNTSDSNLNKLEIDLKFYGTGYDDLVSYLDIPIPYFYPAIDDDLTNWGKPSTYVRKDYGIYSSSGATFLEDSITISGSGTEDISDYKYDTFLNTSFSTYFNLSATYFYYEAYILKNLPSLPPDFSFDKVFLGINLETRIAPIESIGLEEYKNLRLEILWRRWIGDSEVVYSDETYNDRTSSSTLEDSEIIDMPEFHFSDTAPPNQNEKFFFNKTTATEIYGFSNFELSGINNENYNSIHEISVLLFRQILGSSPATSLTGNARCREVCLLFKKSYNIKNNLYSSNEGRIYNDTWNSRFTATDLMENPVSILEHTCRLQNWSECDINPTSDTWGKVYSDNALILTGTDTEGSFDYESSRLNEIRGLKCSRQILNPDDAYSDKIKLSICKNFHLASFTDRDGYERIDRIIESETNPSTEINFGNIINRNNITLKEPSPMNIYPEPFVKFQYDPEEDSFQNIISINNTGAKDLGDTEKESFVNGMEGSEAVEYWNRCATLWERTNQRNDPPEDLTDLVWANGEDAEEIAKIYLTRWIDWMSNPSIEFEVPEGAVSDWELLKRFKLTLPFHTNSVSMECVTYYIAINPNTGIAKIGAVILRDLGDSEPYDIIDVINSLPESSDNWDDNIEEQTDSNDNIIDNI